MTTRIITKIYIKDLACKYRHSKQFSSIMNKEMFQAHKSLDDLEYIYGYKDIQIGRFEE